MAKRKSQLKPDYNDYYFPPSRPIKAENGLQSRSQRGEFASSWWAKRWLAVLETYGIGSRLQRGRSYARGGQVLSIDIKPGFVAAKVQGSQPTPYRVKMEVKPLSDESWEKVLDAISTQALFTATLLEGTMPSEIESVFQSVKVSLFPSDSRYLTTDCTCPDDANPCKHIAAVYYLMGEQFDLDPFLIFTLRGRTREQVMEALRVRRASAVEPTSDDQPMVAKPSSLTEQIDTFWGPTEFEWSPLPLSFPETHASVLKRFDTPPHETQKALTSIYQAMSRSIQARFLTETTDD